jgi:hypothetical protein
MDFSQEEDFPPSNVLVRGSPEHHWSEAALAWFSSPLEHLKIGEKHDLHKILLQIINQNEAPS